MIDGQVILDVKTLRVYNGRLQAIKQMRMNKNHNLQMRSWFIRQVKILIDQIWNANDDYWRRLLHGCVKSYLLKVNRGRTKGLGVKGLNWMQKVAIIFEAERMYGKWEFLPLGVPRRREFRWVIKDLGV